MTTTGVVYLAIGKLLIYLIQKAPYKDYIKWGFLKDLVKCDLCLGWWVYFVLSVVLKQWWFFAYQPIISEIITCSTATFVMWIVSRGWDSQFREIHYD